MKTVAVACDLITPYGEGLDTLWNGLNAGGSAIRPVDRFPTEAFCGRHAGLIPTLDPAAADSLCLQMFRRLATRLPQPIPADAYPLLATTVGEIDLLERAVVEERGNPADSSPEKLLEKSRTLFGTRPDGQVISAACASSTTALALAASQIREGRRDCVLVMACDAVTEFVFAGFAGLLALDAVPCRPFDVARKGLTPGEAAAYVLLMSEARAEREGRAALGSIEGWGLGNDANHMTGPSRDGSGLAASIEQALSCAGLPAAAVHAICAHGTGTVYNDAMEMKAFRRVFGAGPVPSFSLKGALGHSMGATGLVETLLCWRALRSGTVPPTLNLTDPEPEAVGWVCAQRVSPPELDVVLTSNSGFGGINAALVLQGACP